LLIIDTKSGRTVAKFDWKKNPKEAPKSIRFTHDESYCFRLVPTNSAKESNSIEIYRDKDFTNPFGVIQAKFPQKTLQNQKKGMPPTLIDGRFDGLELCPLNPAALEKSPFYVFAW
jgi:uncharacterized protein with WD repeat